MNKTLRNNIILKTIYKSVILFFLIGTSGSCLKKGENDPFISLLTRKARLTGNWKMQSGFKSSGSQQILTETKISDNSYTTLFYKGGQVTYTETGAAKFEIEFEKDGNVKLNRIIGTDQLGFTGSWNFTSGVGKQKNKEQILLHHDKGSLYVPDVVYTIKELRNKKLVLIRDRISEPGNQTAFNNEEFVFIQ